MDTFFIERLHQKNLIYNKIYRIHSAKFQHIGTFITSISSLASENSSVYLITIHDINLGFCNHAKKIIWYRAGLCRDTCVPLADQTMENITIWPTIISNIERNY